MKHDIPDVPCPIERGLAVFGDHWTFLILRDAFRGTSRFADFRTRLGIASDVLTERLAHLVEHGILTRDPYQEPGSRMRYDYHLTANGRALKVVLGAMQQWGEQYLPRPESRHPVWRSRQSAQPLSVAFVDDTGYAVKQDEAALVPESSG